MSNRFKTILALGSCVLFLACGAPTVERGIASSNSDSSAAGSAYNTNDGFASHAAAAPASTPVVAVATANPAVDSTAATTSATSAPVVVKPNAPTSVAAAKPATADDSADIKKGEALISKTDCLACHKVDGKILGPSYKDVAAKYPNNAATIAQLVSKIKKGGSGVWGAVPMSPHPALSDDDAKLMVKYILSLK